MVNKINNRRFRSPKGKKESNLIPTSKWVINCRADGTAPKAWDKRLPSSVKACLLYTSPSPRDLSTSRMPSSA